MPNWRRIKKLRQHLAALPEKAVNMEKILFIDRDRETAAQASRAHCGTVGCLAGHAYVLFIPATTVLERVIDVKPGPNSAACTNLESGYEIMNNAARLLDLDEIERGHMFMGYWSPVDREKTRRRDVLRYLDKAIAEKNIMVKL